MSCPSMTYTRYKFFSSMSYNIGGYVLSLNDIENGILRANRASMATLYMKPFSKTDPRLKIMLSEVEPRIHFALNCGAKSCPPIKTFSGKEVLEQLDVATGAFLENDDALYINDDKTEVRLTQLFQWYQVDFGESMSQVLSWIHQHVTLGIPYQTRRAPWLRSWIGTSTKCPTLPMTGVIMPRSKKTITNLHTHIHMFYVNYNHAQTL